MADPCNSSETLGNQGQGTDSPRPQRDSTDGAIRWPLLFWAGALVLVTSAYFQNQKPQSNALSQFNLTRAIVERGTLSIDAYHRNTIDKAFFGGHYYCDKSPVNAFLGVPVFALYRWWSSGGEQSFDEHRARYWTTCVVEGVAAALLAVMLAVALSRRRVAPVRAAVAGALWIAATPLLGYSIHFYNYLPACAMLMGGYLLVEPEWTSPGALSARRLFAAGLLLGLASWTLNTLALAALFMTLPLLFESVTERDRRPTSWGRSSAASIPRISSTRAEAVEAVSTRTSAADFGGRAGMSGGAAWWRRWQRSWPWMLGGLVGVLGYFAYNFYLFGSFASPYAFESRDLFRTEMSKGLMGATWPRPFVAWLITGHRFQGLFRWFPLTGLALAGVLWRLVRAREEGRSARGARVESVVALLTLVGLLTYTSAYFMWWGGYAYAPRHLIPALPLLALGMVPWLREGRRLTAALLLFVALGSAVFNIAAVSVDPQPWPGLQERELMAPQSVERWPSPYLGLQSRFWARAAPDRNWGHALGLHGRATLLPLAAIWAFAGLVLVLLRRYSRPTGSLG